MLKLHLQSLLSPDLQQQQPLQTVGHQLQRPLRKLLHRQHSAAGNPGSLVQADQRQERPIRRQRWTGELWEEMRFDPRAAAEESVSGQQHRRL